MQFIREYLDMWHPDWYCGAFSDKDTLDCFQEVMEAPLTELDPYLINSTRWNEDFEEALDVYADIIYEKYGRLI